MARYPSRSPRSSRNTGLFAGVAVVVILGALSLAYYFFVKGGEDNSEIPGDYQTVEDDANVPVILEEQENAPNLADRPEPEEAGVNTTVHQIVEQARSLLDEKPGKIIEARDLLNEALQISDRPDQQKQIKQQLSELSEKWLFSPRIFTGDRFCESYTIEPGDQLRLIGRAHNVPYQLLMQINNIKREREIHAGEAIKVVNGPFHAKVHRSSFTLDVYLQNVFVRSYPVGLGLEDRPTPTGLWVVKPDGKLIEPPWTDPDTGKILTADDPNYPLGSRWIGLEGIEGQAVGMRGFGIHGTKEPESIGKASSRGCIRLYNGDAIELYKLLMPGESHVRIVD